MTKVTELNTIKRQLKKGLGRKDGPFVKSLDDALASFHVHRQAYYSNEELPLHRLSDPYLQGPVNMVAHERSNTL